MDPVRLTMNDEALLEHAAWIHRLALQLVRDPATADDLVQDTWLAFLRSGPRDDRPVRPWLARVLRNTAAHRRRRATNVSARERDVAREDLVPSPAELVGRAEAERRLVETVLALEEPYRSTVLLRFYEGWTPGEIARRLELEPATVRTRLHRGLAALRERLDRQEDGDRRAWVVALAPLVDRPGAGLPAAGSGALFTVAALVVAIGIALGAWILRGSQAPAATDDATLALRGDPAESDVGEVRGGPTTNEAARRVASSSGDARMRRALVVDANSGEALPRYALVVDGEVVTSDVDGRFALADGVRFVATLDDARARTESISAHGRRSSAPVPSVEIPVPSVEVTVPVAADGSETVRIGVPSGPSLDVDLDLPPGVTVDDLEARLIARGPSEYVDDGLDRPVAPLRSPLREGGSAWVRFATSPPVAAGSTWTLEVRDRGGFLFGSAEIPVGAANARVELRVTAAVTCRVSRASGRSSADAPVALFSGAPPHGVVAFERTNDDGEARLRWIPPGVHRLEVRASGAASVDAAVEVAARDDVVVDVAVDDDAAAGIVAGTIRSRSGTYDGQLLVFLRGGDDGRMLDMAATTWRPVDGAHTAQFRFEDVPFGDCELDVVSLQGFVGVGIEPAPLIAPTATAIVTVEDDATGSDVEVRVVDDTSGAPVDVFEIEVRVDGSPPRIVQRRPATDESPAGWSLVAGGMRWNRFGGPAPLRRVPDAASLEWRVRADGYEDATGDASALERLGPGRRRIDVRLTPRTPAENRSDR